MLYAANKGESKGKKKDTLRGDAHSTRQKNAANTCKVSESVVILLSLIRKRLYIYTKQVISLYETGYISIRNRLYIRTKRVISLY